MRVGHEPARKYIPDVPSRLIWTASADRETLAAAGYDVVEFAVLQREIVSPARRVGAERTTIANPAQQWLDRVARARRIAVVGVRIDDLGDLATLHGYVLEPALRSQTAVAIQCHERLTRLPAERFVDPDFCYPHTLERAIDAATCLFRGVAGPTSAGDPPRTAGAPPTVRIALDEEQRRAVQAHDGVVQVIAPAGSGKTAVLIERVHELLRRGVPAERILCTTFNRDARIELSERLRAAGIGSVAVRTFHSIGWWLMREEGLARRNGPRELSFNHWKRLCAIAQREEGVWIDPADARAAIGGIKLGLLLTPRELREQADRHPDGATLALIYELYERHLTEQRMHDFDDLVLRAVRALREDPELRRRWQGRFRHVLVDEYQDIEPAQELLMRILAAPQDGFFCVGDEDQTLYGWRRASVRRMIELDLLYPGLERISLAHNYRCPPEVVDASRRLIEHNRIRFPKEIHAGSAVGAGQPLELREHDTQEHGASEVARVLASRTRDDVVVLARTTNLLRTVALACAEVGVRIAAPEQVFEPHGARGALEAYVRLCANPERAEPDDVALVCRAPGRGLPFETEGQVATLLRAGRSFAESFAQLPVDGRRRARLDDAGRILDALAAITDASRFIRYLRGPAGLDEYFEEHERGFGGAERIELEVLEQAGREASGKTVTEYATLLEARCDALRAIRDDAHGIELTTIHRAKGRQWPEVHVFGCEEQQLPHHRALEVTEQDRAAGEGIEAERRLAYVAFTRAQRTLVIHSTEGSASRFLGEAGLEPSVPFEQAATKQPEAAGPRAARRARRGPAAEVLATARRVGLAYALRTAPSRRAALEAAATAIEYRLVGPDTASARMTVAALLTVIEELSDRERGAVLQSSGIDTADRRVNGLDAKSRARLTGALRKLVTDTREPAPSERQPA